MGAGISESEILETLRLLNGGLTVPVWLFGGVAVGFLVGRWTRPHGDIDVNAYDDTRRQLTKELTALGFRSADTGWSSHWTLRDAAWRLEVVFLERAENDSGVLVIAPDAPVGIPGRYPLPARYLDPARYATLEGVSFRVCSPQGEWLARANAREVVAGRLPEPKLEHDRRLLEQLLGPAEVQTLRLAARSGARRFGSRCACAHRGVRTQRSWHQ